MYMTVCRLRDKFCDTGVDFEKCTFWFFFSEVFFYLKYWDFFFTKSFFFTRIKRVKNTKKFKKFWITNMFEGGWIKGFWRILGQGNILIGIYLDWHIFVLAYNWIGIYFDQRIFCQPKIGYAQHLPGKKIA